MQDTDILGDDGKNWNLEIPFYIFEALHGCIKVFQEKRNTDSEDQAYDNAKHKIEGYIGADG